MRRLPFIDMDLDAAGLLAEMERHGGRVADADSRALDCPAPVLPDDSSEDERAAAWTKAERAHNNRAVEVAIRALRLLGLPWSASLPVLVSSMLRWARGALTELVARERDLDNALSARAAEQAVYARRLAAMEAERRTLEEQHAQALAFERAEATSFAERLAEAQHRAELAEQTIAAQSERITALGQRAALAEVQVQAAEGRARAAETALTVAQDAMAMMKAALRIPDADDRALTRR